MADFVIFDMEEDKNAPIIMGRTFLATGRVLAKVVARELVMKVNNEQAVFNIFKSMEYPGSIGDYFAVSIIIRIVTKIQERNQSSDPLEHLLTSKDVAELIACLNNQPSSSEDCDQVEPLFA